MEILRINPAAREEIDAFLLRHWFSTEMAVHGELIDLRSAEGWYIRADGEIAGLLTYRIAGREMEILSLDSLRENRGIGTALLREAIEEAGRAGCERIMLITTNDNTSALRFYQKRGFDIAALHRNAVEQARKIKPQIPLLGNDGIPIRHEIEMEMRM